MRRESNVPRHRSVSALHAAEYVVDQLDGRIPLALDGKDVPETAHADVFFPDARHIGCDCNAALRLVDIRIAKPTLHLTTPHIAQCPVEEGFYSPN